MELIEPRQPFSSPPRGRTGGRKGVAGGAVASWWSNRFGIEGEISDTVTASPFRTEDVATSAKGVRIVKPENMHTTVGIRYKF